ncbi:MAG: hypothetical protein HC806_08930 [Anaerolineae bacterium]|nr:hypothetical protein [Anaerolineae bacterium]
MGAGIGLRSAKAYQNSPHEGDENPHAAEHRSGFLMPPVRAGFGNFPQPNASPTHGWNQEQGEYQGDTKGQHTLEYRRY